MKKLLALFLSLALLAGLLPSLAETASETVPLPAVGDVVEGFEVKEIRAFESPEMLNDADFAMMQQMYHVGRSLNQIATKAHVLNVIDAQRYDESIHMLEKTILKIEDAVIVPQKMEKEELVETSTAYEH